MLWLKINILSKDTCIFILCNEEYEKSKSIYDYNDFLNYKII